MTLVNTPSGAHTHPRPQAAIAARPPLLRQSQLGVQIDLHRKHARAPFHAVTVVWWRKSPEEMAATVRERNRSKVGRMARLKGMVETAMPPEAA